MRIHCHTTTTPTASVAPKILYMLAAFLLSQPARCLNPGVPQIVIGSWPPPMMWPAPTCSPALDGPGVAQLSDSSRLAAATLSGHVRSVSYKEKIKETGPGHFTPPGFSVRDLRHSGTAGFPKAAVLNQAPWSEEAERGGEWWLYSLCLFYFASHHYLMGERGSTLIWRAVMSRWLSSPHTQSAALPTAQPFPVQHKQQIWMYGHTLHPRERLLSISPLTSQSPS